MSTIEHQSKLNGSKDGAIFSRPYKDIRLSIHAQERARERLGVTNFSELAVKAHLSLTEGIDALADPTLREQCYSRMQRHGSSGMYVFEGIVFIFKDETVTTIYPVAWLGGFDEFLVEAA